MSKRLSVIVTVRGEESFLKPTIQNIRGKAGCKTEIIVVYDGTEPDTQLDVDQIVVLKQAKGVGPARHKGIEAAANDIFLVVDAHMDFSAGYGKMILDWHSQKTHAKDVCCGCCVPTFANTLIMDKTQRYTGARFCSVSNEPGGEMWIMSGKWAQQSTGKEIGCVYGACYSMSRKWYRKLGEPWKVLTGWWGDEEYISAASWLAGGRVCLLDYNAGHLFRQKPSFQTGRLDAINRAINRARLVDLLPAPAEIKDRWRAMQEINLIHSDGDFARAFAADSQRLEVKTLRDLFASWTWQNLEPWIDEQERPLADRQLEAVKRRPRMTSDVLRPKLPSIEQAVARVTAETIQCIQIRGVFICPTCRNVNSFRVRHSRQVDGEERRYGKCGHCGRNGVKVNRENTEKIIWQGE